VSDDQIDSSPSDPRTVVRRLLQAGKKLPPELKTEIVALGSAAVPPLVEILEDADLLQADAPGNGYAPIHAIDFLGGLRAAEAVEPMLHILGITEWQDIAHDRCILALPLIGAPVVEPALREWNHATKSAYRESLCAVLANVGVRDERIFSALLDLLQRRPDMGAGDLAEYGDPEALPHLLRAFDEHPLEARSGPLANQVSIELADAVKKLGGTLNPNQREKLRQAMELRQRWRQAIAAVTDGERETDPQVPIRRQAKPGRNEPCWCGSGRKYKKCHLASDERG
jgi:hypothetical protein